MLALVWFVATALAAGPALAGCESDPEPTSLAEIVSRIESQGIRYVFLGERHDVGPVKRFAADLVNVLVREGFDVGLYVEGFRAGCAPDGERCEDLARAFNPPAFRTLAEQAKVTVHALDPPSRERRVARMAESIAAGPERVRVALVGRTHVVGAGRDDSELWVYGGALRYPDPGDLVEAFPRAQTLTIGLDTTSAASAPYELRRDECDFDYVVTTSSSPEYWSMASPGSPGGSGSSQ